MKKYLWVVTYTTEDDTDWDVVVASTEEEAIQLEKEELKDIMGYETIEEVDDFVSINDAYKFDVVNGYNIICEEIK